MPLSRNPNTHRAILHLAIPNLVSNVTVPLLGAIDLAMVGRLNSLESMGAISLGAMIFNFMYWSLGFLRMGTCGFTAQAFGAGKQEETVLTLFRSLILALGGALFLLVLQGIILRLALLWAQPDPTLTEAVSEYFRIRIWEAPATISAFAFAGWFIGRQDSRTPMWVAISINLTNILANYLFIFVFDFGFKGAAMGTVVAQYTGLLLNTCFALGHLQRERANLMDTGTSGTSELTAMEATIAKGMVGFSSGGPGRKKKKNAKGLQERAARQTHRPMHPGFTFRKVFQLSAFKRFLNINSDIFLRTLIIIFVFSFFTAQSTHFGSEYLVLNTLLYQFFIFYSYAMDGFAHAAEALSGRFTGSGEWERKRATVKAVFLWGIGIASAFCLVYALAFNGIFRIFTQDARILELSGDYYFWILGVVLSGFPAFLWDGIYAGSLATKPMLLTMAVAALGFFGAYFLFRGSLHNHSMWLAMLLFLSLRGLCMSLMARRIVLYPKKRSDTV